MTWTIIYFVAVSVALVTVPIATRLALAMGIVDRPGLRKVHSGRVPHVGGVAIVLTLLVLVVSVSVFSNGPGQALRNSLGSVLCVLGTGILVFLIGLVDDIRALPARRKLVGQTIAALIVCLCGIRIESIPAPWGVDVELGWASWPITMLWIVGITNAVNLIDGLDGLAAGISAIA